MIEIDGSYGEGGGQILRTSLSLAARTQTPISIHSIRKRRDKPGLRPQHLAACLSINKLSEGKLLGASINSDSLTFFPGEVRGGQYIFDIGTAGSVTLLAQAIIPVCLAAKEKSHIILKGGTHVRKSPSYDFFENVFLPGIQQLGANVTSKIKQTGFYPAGGGIIELEIEPCTLTGCKSWNRQQEAAIIRLSTSLPLHIAERELLTLSEEGIHNIIIKRDETVTPGNAITIWRGFNSAYSLGKKGKLAEIVAKEAAIDLRQETGEIDRFLADQLLIYAANASGETVFKTSAITEHFKTHVKILSLFSDFILRCEENTVSIKPGADSNSSI